MIVTKECKCYKCKVVLNVGDSGKFLRLSVDSHKHVAMTHFRGYAVICADEGACNTRYGNAFLAKDLAQRSSDAQQTLNILRNTPGMSADTVSHVLNGYKELGLSVK